ncbi:MAG: hypothetical protein WBM14_07480 [Terracidiphilus sp.]|jgi:hypothetical protein
MGWIARMTILGVTVLGMLAAAPVGWARGKQKACVPADEAAGQLRGHAKKDVCVRAHVYDVVQLADGTRYLDVCPPETPDAGCRFTIISLNEDRDAVGELRTYRDTDVEVRGDVQPMRGRMGMVLSNARQFHGGPPRFRPNPMLLHGFTGDQEKPPVSDPNLRSQGGHRGFMNSRDRVPVPAK